MKISAEDIARALIETCQGLTEKQCAEAADAALEALRKNGLTRAVRTFPRVVRREMERQGTVFAELTTPSHDSEAEGIRAALESALKKKVSLSCRHDSSILGGAILQVRDDRYDASVRGSLSRLRQTLSSSVH